MRRTLAVALHCMLAVAVACGEGDLEEESALACEAIPATLKDRLAAGLNGEGRSFGTGYAVRAEAHENAYFIAIEVLDAGAESGPVGVWFKAGAPTDPGLTFSVDDDAKRLTDWGHADETRAEATMMDGGALEAERCVLDA